MNIPATMNAVILTGHGGFDKLEYRSDWPTPSPSAGQVLVAVRACGLNNTDVNTRTGWYSKAVSEATTGDASDADTDDAAWGGSPIVFPRIQGADAVGQVVAVGDGADAALIGQRVMIDTWLRDWDDPQDMYKTGYFGSECNGGFADYFTVDANNVHPVDSDLSDAELATFATSSITAENMLNRAEVAAGDVVLISGASGGVGSALIQLVRRRGAKVVAISSQSKAAGLCDLGADYVIDRDAPNLALAVKEATGNDTVSVVADVVGGAMFGPLLDVLERGGRYTSAGAIAGPIVDFDLRTFYLKDLKMTGATIVPAGVFADLVGYIGRGEIKPLLAATYPLRDLAVAQKAFIEKKHIGNIVVTHG